MSRAYSASSRCSHQLLNHLLLLGIECGCFLCRDWCDYYGGTRRFLLLLLFQLFQSDLLLRKNTYRSQRMQFFHKSSIIKSLDTKEQKMGQNEHA
ncbi:hypothetical protein GOODEAATRI_008843 [Goodea atripinnis]|uniref:Secreted protein n=1 Tax=Goodea atripinnis TaxID=208336 RepID=A0ABV0MZY1_9TELE